ncbi:hypothetical protein BRC81_07205 [Halobacteriales archaeon QS_1_68_20]|nr:MAG: hypothetical protein BRC81_07205 [Halobacteriales archaeon QS_1_68_20]
MWWNSWTSTVSRWVESSEELSITYLYLPSATAAGANETSSNPSARPNCEREEPAENISSGSSILIFTGGGSDWLLDVSPGVAVQVSDGVPVRVGVAVLVGVVASPGDDVGAAVSSGSAGEESVSPRPPQPARTTRRAISTAYRGRRTGR